MRTLTSIIKNAGIAVIKTDTLYGIVGLAKNQQVVDSIYAIKKRDILKPVVVLIHDVSDIESFGITLSKSFKDGLMQYWPGRVSIVIDVPDSIDLHYLHKGTQGIAFRIPDDAILRELLAETGPLVAPSANPEGQKPAKNIAEAMSYFGDSVSFYDDKGICLNENPSKIIRISESGDVDVIRG